MKLAIAPRQHEYEYLLSGEDKQVDWDFTRHIQKTRQNSRKKLALTALNCRLGPERHLMLTA